MQKSGRLYKKTPGLCLYRVPGTIGYQQRSLPEANSIDLSHHREREGERERERERGRILRHTQRKPPSTGTLMLSWVQTQNTCSCVF